MSCAGGKVNFRLLDAFVGWGLADPDRSNLTGFKSPSGIRLTLVNPGAIDPAQVLACLPPSRLARGCGPCEWYLITPFPPEARLLRRDACQREWTPVWQPPCLPAPFVDAVTVAAWRHRVAVADRGVGKAFVWERSGAKLAAEIIVKNPGPMAFTPQGELLITSPGSSQVARYGPDGARRGFFNAALPGNVDRIAVDRVSRVWIVTGDQEDHWKLWRANEQDASFQEATVEELRNSFAPTGLSAAAAAGFCFQESAADGSPVTSCFSWYGRTLKPGEVSPPKPPPIQMQGQLLTGPLDGGIPRCRWHRVRIDADVPAGTALSASVASLENRATPSQGDPSRDPKWSNFDAGQPHPSDWTSAPTGSLDFLIDQPPGRYLFLRLRLTGDGTSTPVVRRVRVDFPRITSLDYLPAVYREDPRAEDFTERFLSLFDASIAGLDRVIERYPALLDPAGVPESLLPWLGAFFDIGFDPAWDADKRRRILQAVPQLYKQRGTLAGMQNAINLVFGVSPVIEELSSTGTWGALGSRQALQAARWDGTNSQASIRLTARLGRVRLFGRTRARFRLDSSPLSGASLRSHGDPSQDPFTTGAYRFQVLIPPGPRPLSKADRDRLTSLIEAQKPAHTIASLRVGGTGFLLGQSAAVGVDTAFTPLAPPILGVVGNVRLNRMSVLWGGPRHSEHGTVLNQNAAVEVQTIAE
jgi:phage tail-like protein